MGASTGYIGLAILMTAFTKPTNSFVGTSAGYIGLAILMAYLGSTHKQISHMSHSACRVYVHAIFRINYSSCPITQKFETPLFDFIMQVLSEHGCDSIEINGYTDHIHILFLLGPNISIAGIMKAIKGGSSHWINQQSFTSHKFAWQVGYFAASVSYGRIPVVKRYIQNQKNHHRKVTFQEECDKLMRDLGVRWVSD